jgi:arginase
MIPERSYHIILVPSELGCGKRGAGLGPESIMYADINRRGELFRRFPYSMVEVYNHELIYPSVYEKARNIDHLVKVTENSISKISACINDNKFPIILTGDHSNAIGGVSGIRNYFPDKRLGVIWIDAHGDLHTPYTTPSGNLHGMPLAACLGAGVSEAQTNQESDETNFFWSKLTHAGDKQIFPKILPQDLVLIDIRDLEQAEWDYLHNNNIKYYTPEDIQANTIKVVAQDSLNYLKHCDIIYLSFDVDSMDPSVSKGTGTSVPNGLSLSQAIELLSILFSSSKIAALEITEVNPLLDETNKMAQSVLEILDSLI